MSDKSTEAAPLTKEENEELAVSIHEVMVNVDWMVKRFGSGRIQATANKMLDHASHAMAMSVLAGPDGLDKAEEIRATADTFGALAKIVKMREKQQEMAVKHLKNKGRASDILRMMGG